MPPPGKDPKKSAPVEKKVILPDAPSYSRGYINAALHGVGFKKLEGKLDEQISQQDLRAHLESGGGTLFVYPLHPKKDEKKSGSGSK